MKKLIIAGLVLVSANCFSQSTMKNIFNRLDFGLKAGANYSNFTHADFKSDAMTGFHAGGIVTFRITNNFFIQEEFLLSYQGAKIKDGVFAGQDIKNYYVAVPILLKYRTNFGLYLEAGPQFSGLAKEDTDNLPVDKFAKKLDLGAAAGIGYQSPIGLGIGARYISGLSSVGDFQIPSVKTDFRSSVVQASIFYIFQ